MAGELGEAVQRTLADESSNIIKQLLGHFDSEWQQIAIASIVIIFVLGVGLTEVMKRLDPLGWFDDSLPEKQWRTNVRRFAFSDALIWSLIIMPAIVGGGWYVQLVKIIVVSVVNGVLTLLGFDAIKKFVRGVAYLISERLRGYVRRKIVDEPAARGEVVDGERTMVKWAKGENKKDP
jgi:hypothetical protein